jgi:hypothetical protein
MYDKSTSEVKSELAKRRARKLKDKAQRNMPKTEKPIVKQQQPKYKNVILSDDDTKINLTRVKSLRDVVSESID